MKKTLLFILLSCFVLIPFDADAQGWEWARSAGLKRYTNGNAVTTDVFGNVYVTGSFSDSSVTFGTTVLHNVLVMGSGGFDIFLVKYDPMGNVIWARSAGGNDSEIGAAITTDGMGNVYISGSFSSDTLMFDNTALINADAASPTGSEDIFIAKYDGSGNLLWAKGQGASVTERPYGLAIDSSDNLYLTGLFSSPSLQLGATTLTNVSGFSADIFLEKLSPSGNILWAKSAGGTGSDGATSVATDAYGNVYIAGSFTSPTLTLGPSILTRTNTFDIFLAKYDTAGNILWARKQEGGNLTVFGFVTTDKKGDVYITGDFSTPSATYGTTTLTNNGMADLFLIKYDSVGNVLWAKNAGGSLRDGPYGITIDTADNVAVTGIFESSTMAFDTSLISNGGNTDVFLAKYDANGSVVFATAIENSGNYTGNTSYSICTDIPGNIYISGTYGDSIFSFGTHTLINDSANTANMFLAKWSNTGTGILSTVGGKPTISLYPNPTRAELAISVSTDITSIKISNLLGQTVYTNNYNSKQVQLDVSTLPAGVYIIKINGNEVRKFVKE